MFSKKVFASLILLLATTTSHDIVGEDAICQDVTIPAIINCAAPLTNEEIFDAIDLSSFEDSNFITRTINRTDSSPLSLGEHSFELTITETNSNETTTTYSCIATVRVEDQEGLDPLAINCDTDGVISPCDLAALSSTPSYEKTNGCPVSTYVFNPLCQSCNDAKKTVNRDTCVVSTDGSSFTILETAGVGSFISFEVSLFDTNDSVTGLCTICVDQPNCRADADNDNDNDNDNDFRKLSSSNVKDKTHVKYGTNLRGLKPSFHECPADWNPSEDTFQCN